MQLIALAGILTLIVSLVLVLGMFLWQFDASMKTKSEALPNQLQFFYPESDDHRVEG